MEDEDEPPRGSFGFPKDFWRDDEYVYPATRPGFHVPTHPSFSYPHALMAVPKCRLQSARTWNGAGLAGQQRCHPQPAQLQPQGSQQRPLQQACLPQQRAQFAGDMDGGTNVVEFAGDVDGGTDVEEIEAEVSSESTDAEGSLLVLEEHMDGPALEVELPVGELVERGPLPVLDPDGPAFEVELPMGELAERGPLPVIDGDSATADSTYNSSGSGTCCRQARVPTFPFDRGKRSPQSTRREEVVGVTHPFDRGKDFGECSMKDGGLRAGVVLLE